MHHESDGKTEVFTCGPSTARCKCHCPDGPCEHEWDGLEIEFSFKGRRECVITCSRCGMDASWHSLCVKEREYDNQESTRSYC
jgi:hypothetical protein